MITPDNRLFCRLDGLSVSTREQQRLLAMTKLGLLEPESVPVFEEATQMAAHFLDAPVCILSLMDHERQWFKSAVGLSRFGLMNELATSRQSPRLESFCTYVVDSHQILAITDTFAQPVFAASPLADRYGVRAYLGVPLTASSGVCLGTLAIMDLKPRQFTDKEIEFLELAARWSMSEFERKILSQPPEPVAPLRLPLDSASIASQLKIELLSELTQELRTPLTSVMGMASVLIREIYGPLTTKQKEYLGIIHNSGQYLLSLVNEILELSDFKDSNQRLNLASVDIEMLCQQAINTLQQAAQRREQTIRLSVEPGRRIWLMDKDKIRQMLHHLIFNVIQSSSAGSIVRLHISHRGNCLTIAIWVSHPWLGEGIPQTDLHAQQSLISIGSLQQSNLNRLRNQAIEADTSLLSAGSFNTDNAAHKSLEQSTSSYQAVSEASPESNLSKNLGLLFSHQLAELHGGQMVIQGSSESGYRYLISLPQVEFEDL